MAIYKHGTNREGNNPNALTIYVADIDVEKPTSGLSVGDLCFSKDNNKLYCAISATSWVEKGGAASVAREDLVTMWDEPSTKTNIGTAFVDIYVTANSAGLPARV